MPVGLRNPVADGLRCRLELAGKLGRIINLTAAARRLTCSNRHSFDFAREGYVSVLNGARRRPGESGDVPEQLQRRTAFLEH